MLEVAVNVVSHNRATATWFGEYFCKLDERAAINQGDFLVHSPND